MNIVRVGWAAGILVAGLATLAAAAQEGLHNESLGIRVVEAEAATRASIRGTVLRDSGEPAVGAQVYLTGTDAGGLTDLNGVFALDAPAAGEWNLVVDLIGFRREVAAVSVSEETRAVLQVNLEPAPVANCGLVVTSVESPPPRVRLSFLTTTDSVPNGGVRIRIRSREDTVEEEIRPRDVGGYFEMAVGSIRYRDPLSVEIESDHYEPWRAWNVRLAGPPCGPPPSSPVVFVRLRPRGEGEGPHWQGLLQSGELLGEGFALVRAQARQ